MAVTEKTKLKKKIFVTGATGFVGSHIAERLLAEGYRVVTLARRTSDTSYLDKIGVEIITGDIRDEKALKSAVKDTEAVVHAAATFVGDWDNHYQINVRGTELLLEASRKAGVKKIVLISSISVYALSKLRKKKVFSEEMEYETKDLNHYSKSKIMQEELVVKYHTEHNLDYAILRPGSIYGPRGSIFPAMTGLALGASQIALMGYGRNPLPYSYVENVADAVWICIHEFRTNGGCYNLVEEDFISRNRYLKTLKERVVPELSVIRVPVFIFALLKFSLKLVFGLLGRKAPLSALNLKTYSKRLYFKTDRAKQDLRKKPYVNFQESIDRTMEWYRQQRIPCRSNGVLKDYRVEPVTGQTLRVGVVGCGGISIEHLKAIDSLNHAQLVALADPDRDARDVMAKKFSISKCYDGIHQMLSDVSLDVVHVTTPPHTHAEISIAAMQKGCHVFVEKPMAVNASEARKMIKESEERNVKLCVGHNILYDEVMIEARQLLSKGSIGRLIYADCWYGTEFNPYGHYGKPDHWVYALPGSLYQDFLIHPLYLLLDVVKDPVTIETMAKYTRTVPLLKTDELRVTLENADCFGDVHLSNSVSPRYQFLTLYGSEGTLKIDFLNKTVFLEKGMGMIPKAIGRSLTSKKLAKLLRKSANRNLKDALTGKYSLTTGIGRLIGLFYRSVVRDEAVPVSGYEGLQSMEVMDEIWKQLDL